jgi:hypothetical protein
VSRLQDLRISMGGGEVGGQPRRVLALPGATADANSMLTLRNPAGVVMNGESAHHHADSALSEHCPDDCFPQVFWQETPGADRYTGRLCALARDLL